MDGAARVEAEAQPAADAMRIQFRPLLASGITRRDAMGFVNILIDVEQSEAQQDIAVWHEALHALLFASGAPDDAHDERFIELAANQIATACPGIAKLLRGYDAPLQEEKRMLLG